MVRPPVVLLDVDGTLLTFADPENDISDPRVAWVGYEQGGIVRYNPAMPGWIHELHATAELRWLTSWNSEARTRLAPALGLPDFEVDEAADFQDQQLDFKEAVVAHHLRAGRRVLWIDDEIPHGDRNDVLHLMGREGAGLFMVRTTLDDGLTEAHMLRIRAFLASGDIPVEKRRPRTSPLWAMPGQE